MLKYFDLQEPNKLASPKHDKWTIKLRNEVDNVCNIITNNASINTKDSLGMANL